MADVVHGRRGRRHGGPALPGVALALALAGCAAGNGADVDANEASPRSTAVATDAAAPRPGLVDPRPLQGAGAVAFDAPSARLAWAAGEEVRMFDLGSGVESQRLAIGEAVADLAYAPDGALWVVADTARLWRDGAPACEGAEVEADRLLAVDAQGAVVARYAHSDGVGMLRHQAWLGADCVAMDESVEPVPEGVADPGADPGAPLRRASLARVHGDASELAERLSQVQLPAGAGIDQAVAVSPDGKWWVLEGAQGRTLWRLDPP